MTMDAHIDGVVPVPMSQGEKNFLGGMVSMPDNSLLKLTDAEVNRIVVGTTMTEGMVDAAALEMAEAIQQLYVEYPDWMSADIEAEVAAIFTIFYEGGYLIRAETLCVEFRREHQRLAPLL
jgi:hypothetical protein